MENVIRFPPTLSSRDIISGGNTGLVLDLNTVLKIPISQDDQPFIDVERRVYERLANGHKRVLYYHGPCHNGLLLQRASNGTLREYLAENGLQSQALQMRWVQQVVESVVYVQSKGVLHADISCRNLFLDDRLDLNLGDFAGSSIDGAPALVSYETSHDHPRFASVSADSEIFALGSVMYEIVTGNPPYKDLSPEEIRNAYGRNDFPELQSVQIFGDPMAKCWRHEYENVDELLQDVITEVSKANEKIVPTPSSLYKALGPRLRIPNSASRLAFLLVGIPGMVFILHHRWTHSRH
ncbi:MAG: hypothetical protein M1825_000775 [Sarcosagium campestre]|nr:MAG: hypothetical protein M1825_000775 [Sarcosagium campestre]